MATISYMIEHEVATSKADPLCILRMKEKKKKRNENGSPFIHSRFYD